MQRVALRSVTEPPSGHRADTVDAHLGGEIPQILLIEAAQPEHGAALPADQSTQALRQIGDAVVADRDEGEHLIGGEPAQREDQRLQGRPIRPVRVVDGEDHRVRLLAGAAEAVEEFQQPGADGDRVVDGVRPVRPGADRCLGRQLAAAAGGATGLDF